ncbi:MAG TPA: pyruvate, phosphate dikinase [Acidimicrobiales bacterium]|nr:pyruvate, phosphate dikinase [Acidimicrobiales bacterium]
MTYVYGFDHAHEGAPMALKELLGGKGANLAEMTSVLDLPVPPGFTITTEACRTHLASGWPEGLDEEVARHLARLEEAMGKGLGDGDDPLLVSVRSGAASSMPGMMDTVLNLGLNDQSVRGLAARTDDERFAMDSYRRFIAMFATIVLGMDRSVFDRTFEGARDLAGVSTDAEVPPDVLNLVVGRFKSLVVEATGSPFPEDPQQQLRLAIASVFDSWNTPRAVAYRNREHLPHDLGTAVNVQAMVFGNRGMDSGTGVGFTRDPNTGAQGAYGDFLLSAQGEDVVAGIRATEPLAALGEHFPAIYERLLQIFETLEHHYRDMCDTEFTIESGKLWMLQTRVGKRTGMAALKMAVDMVDDDVIRLTRAEAVQRITADHLDSVLHPQFEAGDVHTALTTGLAASPGAAVGQAYFTADEAADAAHRGEVVILVRNETSPEDVHGIAVAAGVLTARGGLVSHAAVVARGWGKPAVCGAEAIKIDGASFTVEDKTVCQGDVISIDGTTGEVVLGAVGLTTSTSPPELDLVLGWADELRGTTVAVRANADTAADAEAARGFGAEGIGLCRTEHMFLAEDRLPIVRRMILADGDEAEAEAFEELRAAQRADFTGILEAMDGLPVTVRLLDPPLHEFLPGIEELAVKEARIGLDDEETRLLAAARTWHEVNPMLGTRGVRLGVVKPGLYAMQVRALVEAVADRVAAGGRPVVEVMIPLTISREELALARGWVEGAIRDAAGEGGPSGAQISIGTMIEVPRAALLAGELAEEADFFSFGTNDLTQMTLGFSRDDVEARIMGAYLEAGLLARNPFETIDRSGVGELVRIGVERGRATKPDLKVGVCGEHGGDPLSIGLFVAAGLDYVSCSPFRVPIARLAAAQAVLRERASG